MSEPAFAARHTRWYVPAEQAEPRLNAVIAKHAYARAGFNAALLRQDSRDLLPPAWSSRGEFEATVTADDPVRARTALTDALAQTNGETTLEAVLTEFFASLADVLLRYPVAYREVVFGHVPSGDGEPATAAFRLLHVPAGTVGTRLARPGKLVQYVPAAMTARPRRRVVEHIELDPDTLAAFRLPAVLQRRVKNGFAAIAAAEAEFSTAVIVPPPRLWGRRGRKTRKAAPSLTEATAAFGWNGRTEPLTSEQLQPFHIWRRLEHLAFKIEMRDAILDCLNHAVHMAGQHIGMPARIELQHVTSLEEVRRAQEDLRHGRQSLEALGTWAVQ